MISRNPHSRVAAAIAIAIGIAAACVSASSSSAEGAGGLFFDDVRVFDGVRMHERADVSIRDGRIVAIGANLQRPADAERIDGAGKTLLPGLIDAHTHSWGDARRDALRFGVTTELDMMGDRQQLPRLKTERAAFAATDQADLWSAGAAVTAPKGHGTQYGMAVPTLAAGEDATAFVKARVAEGSDYVKIIVEDFSAHSETMRLPTLTEAQTRAAIAAAHAEDKLAVVHVSRLRDGRAAVENGADGLVHMFVEPGDAAFVAASKRRNAFVVPTLSVIATMARADEGRKIAEDARLSPWLTRAQIDALNATYGAGAPRPDVLADAIRNVGALHAAGVDLLAGTDAGNPGTAHGASIHGEMELLVRAGLTPTQALAAATSTPARRFALSDRGRIAEGLRADLLLVDGDPAQDIRATRAIVGVWKNGHAVARPRQDAQAEAPRGETLPASAELIDDFEGAVVGANGLWPAKFGSGWAPTTDQMAGGASVGKIDRANGALAVSGEIKAGFAFPWSGAMYFPANAPMQPVDLSGRGELVFKARGDGRTYNAMLFSGAQMQSMPSMKIFVAGPEWTEIRLPLASINGADLARVRGFAFTAGQPLGAFAFEIDDVRVK